LIITDLPGCVNNDDPYFNEIKNAYLNRYGNIIIYVARADVDPELDISLNFLKDTPNEKICVLTHIDILKLYPEKKMYLEKYIEKFKGSPIFLVDNKGNELESLNEFTDNRNVILGILNLSQILSEKVNKKISDMLPIFAEKVNILSKYTNNQLEKIGAVPPTKEKISIDYISYLCELINDDVFDDFPGFMFMDNIPSTNQLMANIQIYFLSDVPQPGILSIKIQNADENYGWDSIFKEYIDIMTKSIFVYLSNIIDKYFDNILSQLLNINYDYVSRTVNIEKIIKSKIKIFIMDIKENAKSNLNILIYEIISNKDRKYMEAYQREIINSRIIDYSKSVTKICTSVIKIKSLESVDLIRNDIIKESYSPDLADAKEKYIELKHKWNYKCKKISDIFYDPIYKYENTLKENIFKMIKSINSIDIDNESIEDISYRDNLIRIEELCRTLRGIMRNYSCDGLHAILANYS
jgi:hypothetical protein